MKCPVCEKNNPILIKKICSNMQIMGETFSNASADLVYCGNCNMVYVNSKFNQQDYLGYYCSDSCRVPNYHEMFGKEDTESYYQEILNRISYLIPDSARILDVAGAYGEFGEYILLNRPDVSVYNLDPKTECVEASVIKGVIPIPLDASTFKIEDNEKFDFVIMNHSLEHFIDVNIIMNNIRQCINDAGSLYIELPDGEAYSSEESTPYGYLTYEHVSHFGMNDLKNLVKLHGFSIIESGYSYKECSKYPCIWMILKRGERSGVEKLVSSGVAKHIKDQYLNSCSKAMEIATKQLKNSQEPIILWGIGTSTTMLLEDFKGCNVLQLIDGNVKRQGLSYSIGEKDFIINSPLEISSRDATIIILSIPYEKSIKSSIRKELNIHNKVVSIRELLK